MMVSMRRLRAVLLLSLVSAIGWALLGALFVIGYLGFRDGAGSLESGLEAMPMFAFFGFLAGLIYAVALGLSTSLRYTTCQVAT